MVISSLLLYRALVADQVNPEKNTDEKSRIQRLEERVKELEEQLNAV